MLTYLTLDSELLDVAGLAPEQVAFLDQCVAALAQGMPYVDFVSFIHGPANPGLEPNQRVTLAVRETPLYRAARDLAERAGIAQGKLLSGPNDAVDVDPFTDEAMPVAAAAVAKGVSVKAIHKAVERGDLIATPGYGTKVSWRSFERWGVLDYRQRAGKLRSKTVGETAPAKSRAESSGAATAKGGERRAARGRPA